MVRILFMLLLGIFLLPSGLPAQEGCGAFDRLMQEAQGATDNRNYQLAIRKYNAAKVCRPSAGNEIDERILGVFARIEGEKELAERNARRAQRAEKQARQALQETEAARQRTEEARKKADRAAISNLNTARALQLAQSDPTLALRMAEFNEDQFPEQPAAGLGIHEVLSKGEAFLSKVENFGDKSVVDVSPDGEKVLLRQIDSQYRYDFGEFHEYYFLANDGTESLVNGTGARKFHPDGDHFLYVTSGGAGIATDREETRSWEYQGFHEPPLPQDNDTLVTYDPVTYEERYEIILGAPTPHSVDISANGNVLMAGFQRRVFVWPAGGGCVDTLDFTGNKITKAALSPDGRAVLAANAAGQVFYEDVWSEKALAVSETTPFFVDEKEGFFFNDIITALAFSPQGEYIAIATGGGAVSVWEDRLSAKVKEFNWKDLNITHLSFSSDGEMLRVGTSGGRLESWFWNGLIQQTYELGQPQRGNFNISIDRLPLDGSQVYDISPDGATLLLRYRKQYYQENEDKYWYRLSEAPDTFSLGISAEVKGVHPEGLLIASDNFAGVVNKEGKKKMGKAFNEPLRSVQRDTVGFIDPITFEVTLREVVTPVHPVPHSVDASADGRTFLAGFPERVFVWQAATERIDTIEYDHPIVTAMLSPDGGHIVAADSLGQIYVKDRIISNFYQPKDTTAVYHFGEAVRALAWSPDGQQYAVAGVGGKIEIRHPYQEEILAERANGDISVFHLSFSENGDILRIGGAEGLVVNWRWKEPRRIASFQEIHRADFSPDLDRVVISLPPVELDNETSVKEEGSYLSYEETTGESGVGSGNNLLCLMLGGEVLFDYPTAMDKLEYSANGQTFAGVSGDWLLRWDRSGELLSEVFVGLADTISTIDPITYEEVLVVLAKPIVAAGFLSSGTDAYYIVTENRVFLGQGKIRKHLRENSASQITAYNFAVSSPAGSSIAVGNESGLARWYEVKGSREQVIGLHQGPVTCIAFDNFWNRVASGGFDGSVQITNLSNQQQVRVSGPGEDVTSIAFSRDGALVLAGYADGTLKLWNAEGTALATFKEHQAAILDVAFATNGQSLFSIDKSGQIIQWRNPVYFMKEKMARYEVVEFIRSGFFLEEADLEQLIRSIDSREELYNLADYYEQVGDWKWATFCLERYLQKPDPEQKDSLYWDQMKLVNLYLKNNDQQKFEQLIGKEKLNLVTLAGYLENNENWIGALQLWRRIMSEDPEKEADYWMRIYQVAERGGIDFQMEDILQYRDPHILEKFASYIYERAIETSNSYYLEHAEQLLLEIIRRVEAGDWEVVEEFTYDPDTYEEIFLGAKNFRLEYYEVASRQRGTISPKFFLKPDNEPNLPLHLEYFSKRKKIAYVVPLALKLNYQFEEGSGDDYPIAALLAREDQLFLETLAKNLFNKAMATSDPYDLEQAEKLLAGIIARVEVGEWELLESVDPASYEFFYNNYRLEYYQIKDLQGDPPPPAFFLEPDNQGNLQYHLLFFEDAGNLEYAEAIRRKLKER